MPKGSREVVWGRPTDDLLLQRLTMVFFDFQDSDIATIGSADSVAVWIRSDVSGYMQIVR